MKLPTSTVAALLGQLSALAMVAQAAQKKIEIPAAGYTFKLSLFDDGRTTPYRVFFADEYLTGSSYRLSAEGTLSTSRQAPSCTSTARYKTTILSLSAKGNRRAGNMARAERTGTA